MTEAELKKTGYKLSCGFIKGTDGNQYDRARDIACAIRDAGGKTQVVTKKIPQFGFTYLVYYKY
jgi:hypothetical protein